MSKVTLLSCPNPYCTADDGPRIWSTGVDCMTQCNHAVQCSCGITVAGTSIEEAVDAWNFLPRALEWTEEPQLGAWNWWRDENSRIPRYVYADGTVAIAMQIDRVPYQDLGGQWCLIPEPREPKE